MPEEKIEELYERIFELNTRIIGKDNTMELVREKLLHSKITIEECEFVLHFINKVLGDSYE